MFKILSRLLILFTIAAMVLTACNLPTANTQPTTNPVGTAAAQTVVARLTEAAVIPASTATPQPGLPTQQPSITQVVALPTATQALPQPTATQALPQPTAIPATATQVPTPCDRAEFVSDVTIPDNSDIPAGSSFTKTWRLKNTGTCTWNSSYALVFFDKNAMGGPASQQLTTATVAPGQTIDVSVQLKAPDTTGTYEGDWKLRNGSSVLFGIGGNAGSYFYVKIKVVSAVTPTPNATVHYDFLAKAKDADWANGSGALTYGDPQDDAPGIAVVVQNMKMNDNKTYASALATYPQRVDNGKITGLFPAYTVVDGDHFHAVIGFRSGCGNGKVKFQLNYVEGTNSPIQLGEWSKTCDGKLVTVDVDLASIKGKSVRFMLAVVADGAWDGDLSMWIDPRIQK